MSVMTKHGLLGILEKANQLNSRQRPLGDGVDAAVDRVFAHVREAMNRCESEQDLLSAGKAWLKASRRNLPSKQDRAVANLAYSRFSQCVSDALNTRAEPSAEELVDAQDATKVRQTRRPGRRCPDKGRRKAA